MNLEKLMERLDKFAVIGISGTDLFTGQVVGIDRLGLVVPAVEGQNEIGWMSENVGAGVRLAIDAETGEVFSAEGE